MATHSSILAWEIPWTEDPGGLQSTGVVNHTMLHQLRVAACSTVLRTMMKLDKKSKQRSLSDVCHGD